jgi:hypothetical protein
MPDKHGLTIPALSSHRPFIANNHTASNTMNDAKKYLITAAIALVAVGIAARVDMIGNVVFNKK